MAIESRLNEDLYARIYKIGTCPDSREIHDPEWTAYWNGGKSWRWYCGDIEGLSFYTDCVKIEVYQFNKLVDIHYDRGGRLHRENSPAKIEYDDGVVVSESWYINGYPHREDAPAHMRWKRGKLVNQQWCIRGKLHRIDGPVEEWWDDDIKSAEAWGVNGVEHRVGDPSSWSKWSENQYKYIHWKENGKFHRADGPARQTWKENGTLKRSQWYWRGKQAKDWLVLAQAALPTIHAGLPQPIAEEIVEQFGFGA